jgi:hypothetical protein
MSKSSYEDGRKQAEKDIKNNDVSKSLQKYSVFDGSLGASHDFKRGYRDALKDAGYKVS